MTRIYQNILREKKIFLNKKLGRDFEIHHIGSSAVPGLGGKNVEKF